ncbi:hypothetical protein BD311DRAFT_767975 [Dichomitus squalens]|uniref:Secreted protein n=1 Tax=Dichomitus squalens TaxID=114155 RepID=A0A4Q9MBP7_9APHY|nr:hypothetical protein BD311DRAFT_767975 [Dichomitus squalens]
MLQSRTYRLVSLELCFFVTGLALPPTCVLQLSFAPRDDIRRKANLTASPHCSRFGHKSVSGGSAPALSWYL